MLIINSLVSVNPMNRRILFINVSSVKLCCLSQFTVHFMIGLLSIVQAKEKKTKGGLMSRFTSMKKSKSPPPATYSMDNPVFDDGSATASPQHPVHVR